MDVVRPNAKRRAWKKRAVVAAAATAIVSVCVASWWRTSSASAMPLIERSSAWTERVARGDLLRQVPVQGTLVPEHVQWLSAPSAGRVARIAVRPGAQVEADTVVVVLENTDLELSALEAERQATSAQAKLIELDVKTSVDEKQQTVAMATLRADLRDADRHAGDANRLGREGLVSENERRDAIERAAAMTDRFGTEEAKREVLVAGRARQLSAQHAEIDRLKEIAQFRRRQLAAMEIRAGIRGVVQDIPLENGQWVVIGALLAKVAEPGRLKAEVKVAESYARDIQRGLPVRFEGSGPTCLGHVERIDPAVVGGSVRLEVTLDEALPNGARAAQNVTGYVEIEKIENVLHVARPAGAREGGSMGLFRLSPDGSQAARSTVQLGRTSAREVEVVAGLAEGDQVIVSDTSAWGPAQRIRLK